MKRVLTVMMVLCLALAGAAFARNGEVLYEYWSGIGGTSIGDLTANPNYPDNPSGSEYRTSFEAPWDWADDYGCQMTGWVVAPETGQYTFYIASDDAGELWLSPDTDPANRVQIAFVAGWTPRNAFVATDQGEQDNQRSAPISLVQGKKYSIMARMKEGGGGDNLSVAWEGPGITGDLAPIAGEWLATDPWGRSKATNPTPADGAEQIDPEVDLVVTWEMPVIEASGPVVRWDIYADTDPGVGDPNSTVPVLVSLPGDQLEVTIPASQLDYNTVYYWRIDTIVDPAKSNKDPNNAVGDLWQFRTILTVPVITSQPSRQWAWPGESARFEVAATGDPLGGAITYQWHFNGNAIPGETDTSLSITSVSEADAGSYYCAVSNDAGTVNSATVQLGIKELLAWYKLDDDAAEDPNVIDSSGNDRHGQIIGSVASAEGKIGGALSFDGGYVRTSVLPADMGLAGNEPRTFCAWVYTRGFGNGGIFDMGNRDATQNFSLRTLDNVDNRWRIQYWGGDWDFTTSGAGNGKNVGSYEAPTLNTWAHFVHTHDGANTKIYLNGRLIVDWAKTINTGNAFTFRIGRYGPDDAGNNFNGLIDDVQVYNYPMDATEVALMYTDIELDEMVCVGGNPQYDLNGNCRVDLPDLVLLASQWLECNLVPDCKP